MQLHDELGASGLEILAFPCNQFGKQEPKSCEEVQRFAVNTYGVEFTMMDKVNVNGHEAHPVFNYLKAKTNAKITWNFGCYSASNALDDFRESFAGKTRYRRWR